MRRITAALILFAISVWGGLYFIQINDPNNEVSVFEPLYCNFSVEGIIEETLKDLEISFISRNNAEIDYFDYRSTLKSIPLTELEQYLDERDPRFDEYMKKIATIFTLEESTGEVSRVIYIEVPENSRIAAFYSRMDSLESDEWFWSVLPDNKLYYQIILVLFFVGILLFGVSNRIQVSLTVGCILFVSFFGSSVYLLWMLENIIPYILLLDFFFSFCRRKSGSGNGFRYYLPLVVSAVLFGWNFFRFQGDGNLYWSNTLPLFMGGVMALGIEQCRRFFQEKRMHTLFEPVPIAVGGTRKRFPLWFLGIVGVVSVLGVGNFFLEVSGERIRSKSPETIYQLENLGYNTVESGFSVLTTGDYLAHRAFQESYFFGGTYRTPEVNDQIRVSSYYRQGNRLVEESQVAVEFDEEWFELLFKDLGLFNPIRILSDDAEGQALVRTESEDDSIDTGFPLGRLLTMVAALVLVKKLIRLWSARKQIRKRRILKVA